MAILYDLPYAENLRTNKNIKFLATPPRIHYIEINYSLIKDDYIRKVFYEVELGMALLHPQKINNYMQAQQKKYGLKHCDTVTIHAAMGDTLKKVALKIVEIMFEHWNKSQYIIFVGNKQETV